MWSRRHGRRLFLKLQATVAIMSVLSAYVTVPAMAQQPAQGGAATPPAVGLPPAPVPNYTEPLFMRPSDKDFTQPHKVFPNYLKTWEPITVAAPVTTNSQRLDALVHNGKIYLSLADAIVLGLENNYDIAIQRYNLDIADTDLLRARAGSNLLGVSSGLVEGTLGGGTTASTSLSSGGGPGGTSTAVGGRVPAPLASCHHQRDRPNTRGPGSCSQREPYSWNGQPARSRRLSPAAPPP